MKNLVLLLLLANILYFVWGKLSVTPHEPGVEIVTESALGPGMAVTANRGVDAVASVGEILGSGSPSELAACLLYTSPSPRDQRGSRMPSSA